MLISVIIPSRLQTRPHGSPGALWLDRALASVFKQTQYSADTVEILVGLDPGCRLPRRTDGVRGVNGRRATQACAVNAAVNASRGEVLAFLEDDDFWDPVRLEIGLPYLSKFALVTSNQHEIDEAGKFIRINDYPTPSGWLLRRETWDRLGPFDESLLFHVDSDYLGRLHAVRAPRVHLVEAGADSRPLLCKVQQWSAIVMTKEPAPLVIRTANPRGGMALIGQQPWAAQQAWYECQRIQFQYGVLPW